MPSPAEKLAAAPEILHELQNQGLIAIKHKDIPKIVRQRLIKNGFLKETTKGWLYTNITNGKGR